MESCTAQVDRATFTQADGTKGSTGREGVTIIHNDHMPEVTYLAHNTVGWIRLADQHRQNEFDRQAKI